MVNLHTFSVRHTDRVDTLEQKQQRFFSNCRRMKPGEREEEFASIRREYERAVEESGEKVQSAEECYNLVDRYLRKLDHELHNFKLELEADNRGITEVLEKRSLEMDVPSETKENRLPKKHVRRDFLAGEGGPYLVPIFTLLKAHFFSSSPRRTRRSLMLLLLLLPPPPLLLPRPLP